MPITDCCAGPTVTVCGAIVSVSKSGIALPSDCASVRVSALMEIVTGPSPIPLNFSVASVPAPFASSLPAFFDIAMLMEPVPGILKNMTSDPRKSSTDTSMTSNKSGSYSNSNDAAKRLLISVTSTCNVTSLFNAT